MNQPIVSYEIQQPPASVRRVIDRWNKRAVKARDKRRVSAKSVKQPSGRVITQVALQNLRGRWASLPLMATDEQTVTAAIRVLLMDARETVAFEF